MHFVRVLILLMGLLGLGALAAQVPQLQPETAMEQAPPSQPSPEGVATLNTQDVTAWLDGFMPYALDHGRIAGAVVVVVKDGETIAEKGYGYADLAEREPVDPQTTLFRPGSVSKLFTWTAVMQQVEAGTIDLDADINTYLDFEVPHYEGKPVTMRHLMTHTAGFEESVRHLISDRPDAIMPLRQFAIEDLPAQVYAPGTTPAYSNYGTALAGYIVERVSGMPFDDYIDQRIFTPLDMQYATFRQPLPDRLEPFMSKGYVDVTQAPKDYEMVIPAPAGSLAASGSAMGKFMIAHLANGGPILQPQTAREMHDYRAPGVGPLNTMALGFYEQWVNGRRAIAHGGDTQWFHSDLWLFPEENVGVYISVNSAGRNGAASAIRSALFHNFADRYFPAPDDLTPIDAETARQHAEMMAGTYVSSRGSFTNFMSVLGLAGGIEVTVGPDGELMVPGLDGIAAGARDWIEVAPFVWRDRATGERLAATVENGEVKRFSIDAISPFMVMVPAPAATNPAWLMPVVLAALFIVVLAALAWPLRAIVRRRFKADFMLQGRALTAYRLSRLFAWLVILAVAGWVALVMAFSADIGAIGGPLDWLINLLRILTPLAALGLIVTAGWHLWLCLRGKQRWTMVLGAVLLLLAGLVFGWVTIQFNLYGFGMVY